MKTEQNVGADAEMLRELIEASKEQELVAAGAGRKYLLSRIVCALFVALFIISAFTNPAFQTAVLVASAVMSLWTFRQTNISKCDYELQHGAFEMSKFLVEDARNYLYKNGYGAKGVSSLADSYLK